jgi:hypothetical protein
MRIRILLAGLTVVVAVVTFAQRSQTSLQPRVLIVFKNGLSWIEHRGEVVLSGGWGVVPNAPEAVLGTVSVTSDRSRVDEVRTVGSSKDSGRSLSALDGLLRQNVGKMVTLRIGERDVSGRLLPLPKPDADIVLLESGGKTIAVPRSQIGGATFDGAVTDAPDTSPSLRFHVQGDTDSAAPVRISYLRPGIGWFPDYSIILDGAGQAELTMRATLVNDGEDLRGTDVFFAVGVPTFAFGSIESPLSGRQTLMDLFRALGRGTFDSASLMVNSMANITSQMAMPDTGRGSAFDAVTTAGTQGESGDDFFFYSRKDITLAKGERSSFPLLQASVKYADVYTLDIPREAQSDVYNRQAQAPTPDRVWHSIRLHNPTKLPWTTAPALVFAGGRPVSQETLRYTPALGETVMRLTVANNVVADRSEVEASRQREAVRRFGDTWDAVTIDGTIEVRNFKEESVVLAISREVEGEAIPSSGLRIVRVAAQPRAVNPIERLHWEIPLAAGEKKTIKYQYKVYVRG